MTDSEIDMVSVDGLLAGASNVTLLARDAEGMPWVYKPAQGERPLWDFTTGSLAAREVACHRLSEALGLGCVPETRFADGPFGYGSAQRFLTEDFGWDPRRIIVDADPVLWPIVVLDIIANNADRKIGHLLTEPGSSRIWAIDNGLTFHLDEKLRTVLWSFAGLRLPPELIAALRPEAVASSLTGILAEQEVAAAVNRVERLAAHPVHPPPPEDRPSLPWPLW